MNAESAVEALKAIHVEGTWIFGNIWNEQWEQYESQSVKGCRSCGGQSIGMTVWPCETLLRFCPAHAELFDEANVGKTPQGLEWDA